MGQLFIAVCQMITTPDKEANLEKAAMMIDESARRGAEMVVLPEMFNGPYQADLFSSYAETYPGLSTLFLSEKAKKHGICIVGGSIIEKDREGKLYNSSFVFDDRGSLIARHRKLHLFDIDVPGKIAFKESDSLCAGNEITIFSYRSISTGVMICYDIRFPELTRAYTLSGTQLIVVPAAFNLVTGPLHWEILMRCRAVDNQVYIIAASPARSNAAGYQAWGHSMVVDPWGRIKAQAESDEEILFCKIDLQCIRQVRNEIPVLKQRRTDLY